MFGIDDALMFTAGSKLLGGFLDNSAAADRQEAAQAFSAQQYATRYQTQVKDMQAAGLNPMLSYTQAPSNSPGGVVSTPGNQYSSVADTVLQSKINSAHVANLQADTANKEADTGLKRAQTFLTTAQEALTGASADQTRTNIGFLEMQSKKIAEEIKNIPSEGARLEALVKNLNAEYSLIRARTGTEQQAQNQMKWLAVKTMIESDLTNLDYEAAKKFDNMGRNMREAKPVFDILNAIIRSGKGK